MIPSFFIAVSSSGYVKIGNMAIFDIYSKRQQRTGGNSIDVFEYDKIPPELRVQIRYIIEDLVGRGYTNESRARDYATIKEALAREYGQLQLANGNTDYIELFTFIQDTSHAARVLDAIEVTFQFIAGDRSMSYIAAGARMSLD
jgi:hypothetical protein